MARFSSSETRSTSVTWKSEVLPTIVTTPAPRFEQGLHAGVLLGGRVFAAGHAEGGNLGVLERQLRTRWKNWASLSLESG